MATLTLIGALDALQLGVPCLAIGTGFGALQLTGKVELTIGGATQEQPVILWTDIAITFLPAHTVTSGAASVTVTPAVGLPAPRPITYAQAKRGSQGTRVLVR